MLIDQVVVNASPLITLFKSQQSQLLPALFREIIVPEQDRQDWAATQVGLASIAAARDDLPAARRWLQSANVVSRLLNENRQGERIEQWMRKPAFS